MQDVQTKVPPPPICYCSNSLFTMSACILYIYCRYILYICLYIFYIYVGRGGGRELFKIMKLMIFDAADTSLYFAVI